MKRGKRSEARQRILETADRLFYQEGICAVGIDRIVAEAGVAKMTLYTHFPSKNDLILAVLQYREETFFDFLRDAMERHRQRLNDPLHAFFASLKEWFTSPDFHGCAFQNAAMALADPNHPATRFARDHKRRFTEMLRSVIEQSVGREANEFVPMIALLVEGAMVTAAIQGTPEAADIAWNATQRLVQASARAK